MDPIIEALTSRMEHHKKYAVAYETILYNVQRILDEEEKDHQRSKEVLDRK